MCRLDSLERCAPGLLTHKLLRTYLQQYSLRELPEVVKLTMLIGLTSVRRARGDNGPVSLATLRRHAAEGHAAAAVGGDISAIEARMRSMKDEIEVFGRELRATGHEDGDDAGGANAKDRKPLQNRDLEDECAGASQVIRPLGAGGTGGKTQTLRIDVQDGAIDEERENNEDSEDDETDENTMNAGATPYPSKKSVRFDVTDKIGRGERRQQQLSPASTRSTVYFKPSSRWRKGTGKDETGDGANAEPENGKSVLRTEAEHVYTDYEVSKMIYPSWWFHPGGAHRPRKPMSEASRDHQPRLAYKGPTRREEEEKAAVAARRALLDDDLVTAAYVGVPSSGYGQVYNVNERNDTNKKGVDMMKRTLREVVNSSEPSSKAVPSSTSVDDTKQRKQKKERPRFNNYLKPTSTTESRVRERLLREHAEVQRRHDARLQAIEEAFYPAKHEAKKSIAAAMEKIRSEASGGTTTTVAAAAGVPSQNTTTTATGIVDNFFANPLLSRFCVGMRDDDRDAAGLHVLGTVGVGADIAGSYAEQEPMRMVRTASMETHSGGAREKANSFMSMAAEEDGGEHIVASVAATSSIRAPERGPGLMQSDESKALREPWVADFGHLENFPRFPRRSHDAAADPGSAAVAEPATLNDNVLFEMAHDSKIARDGGKAVAVTHGATAVAAPAAVQTTASAEVLEKDATTEKTATTTVNPILAASDVASDDPSGLEDETEETEEGSSNTMDGDDDTVLDPIGALQSWMEEHLAR